MGETRTVKAIKEVKDELDQITEFISEHGTEQETKDTAFQYACNISDGLS